MPENTLDGTLHDAVIRMARRDAGAHLRVPAQSDRVEFAEPALALVLMPCPWCGADYASAYAAQPVPPLREAIVLCGPTEVGLPRVLMFACESLTARALLLVSVLAAGREAGQEPVFHTRSFVWARLRATVADPRRRLLALDRRERDMDRPNTSTRALVLPVATRRRHDGGITGDSTIVTDHETNEWIEAANRLYRAERLRTVDQTLWTEAAQATAVPGTAAHLQTLTIGGGCSGDQ